MDDGSGFDYGSSLSRARLPESCRSRTSRTGHFQSFEPHT